MRMKHSGAILLLVLATGACGRDPEFRVMVGKDIVTMSASEVAAKLDDGKLAERSLVFVDGKWLVFVDHAPTRELVDAAKKRQAAKAVPPPAPVAAQAANVPPVLLINKSRPGERIEVRSYTVPGKTVIFDFYSEYCPPCRQIAPYLERLAMTRSDIVVRTIDINRAGVKGIDWNSPVAEQYALSSIPNFMIFDPQGKLVAEGKAAKAQVNAWVEEL